MLRIENLPVTFIACSLAVATSSCTSDPVSTRSPADASLETDTEVSSTDDPASEGEGLEASAPHHHADASTSENANEGDTSPNAPTPEDASTPDSTDDEPTNGSDDDLRDAGAASSDEHSHADPSAPDASPSEDDVGSGASDSETEPAEATEPETEPDMDTEPPDPTALNGCTNYADRTADDASRQIIWYEDLIDSPARCMRIRVGQVVTFVGGSLDDHPLAPYGGDTPSPVPVATSGDTPFPIGFNTPGIFGYVCVYHPSTMVGTIWVVEE